MRGLHRFVMEQHLIAFQPRLIEIARRHHNSDGAHDISHLERVWANARWIMASHRHADRLAVMAACYLHDLVNPPKDSPDRRFASRSAAREATLELSRSGFPKERLAAVAHAIEAHSFSAGIEPRTLEAAIVQDADRIDALGAVGLARMFHIGGQMGRGALAHPTDPLALDRPLDDSAYALDHIGTKLARLPGSMKTEAGRKLAEARLEFIMRFREQFIAEWSYDNSATAPDP